MSSVNYDKIISTVNSVTQNITVIPDQDNVIMIDTSNNRIGINTLHPSYSIDVKDNPDMSGIIYGDHIRTDTVIGDLKPDIDICYNLGSSDKQWNNMYVKHIISDSFSANDVTAAGNTYNVTDGIGTKIPALGYNNIENKVELKNDVYSQHIDAKGINIQDPKSLTFNQDTQPDDTINFTTNIDISRNATVRENLTVNNTLTVKHGATDVMTIQKTTNNRVIINLGANEKVRINGKLMVTGEIENDYLVGLIQGTRSGITITNNSLIDNTDFYTLYNGNQLVSASNINSNVSFNDYKSLSAGLQCGFLDDYNISHGFNLYFTNETYTAMSDSGTLNTRTHLSYYNQLDLSSVNFLHAYNDGSEQFFEISNNQIRILQTADNYSVKLEFTIRTSLSSKIKGDYYYIDVALMQFTNYNDNIPSQIILSSQSTITQTSDQNHNFTFTLNQQTIAAGTPYGLGFLIYVDDTIYGGSVSGINTYYDSAYLEANYTSDIEQYTDRRFYMHTGRSNYETFKTMGSGNNRYLYSKWYGMGLRTGYNLGNGFRSDYSEDKTLGINIFTIISRDENERNRRISTKRNYNHYNLIPFESSLFFESRTFDAGVIRDSGYKLRIYETGRYNIRFSLRGFLEFNYYMYTYISSWPAPANNYTTVLDRSRVSVQIILLKNVDTEIGVVKNIDGSETFQYNSGSASNTNYPSINYNFSNNILVDFSQNDTLSFGILFIYDNTHSTAGNKTRSFEGINDYRLTHGDVPNYYVDIIHRPEIGVTHNNNNYFSVIKLAQNFGMDVDIPQNSIDYSINKTADKNFTDIIIENSLTLNNNATLHASNVDFSGLPQIQPGQTESDISSGYLYVDGNNYIKMGTKPV